MEVSLVHSAQHAKARPAIGSKPKGGVGATLLWVVALISADIGIVLTGGLVGPLAILCMLPLLAVLSLRRERSLPEAVALIVFTLGGIGMMHAGGLIAPVPSAGWNLALSVASLLGLAVALLASLLARAQVPGHDVVALDGIEPLLSRLPHRLLLVGPKGQILQALGQCPEWADPTASSISQLAGIDDRAALNKSLVTAKRLGSANVRFRPDTANPHLGELDLRALAAGGFIGLLRDASADQRRESDLVRAREDAEASNAARARFLANMSHELRTPLNAIMGFSDIMRSQMFGPLPGKYTDYAGLIHEAGEHLLDLINDVLDMSKIEAERYELQLETQDVRDPVTGALRLLRLQADEAGIRLRGVLPSKALEANIDRRAVKQMVINLLGNALKFTPKGGEVIVTLQAFANSVELIVADTGIGISPDDLIRLGQPYVQAKSNPMEVQGTGLGLSLVRALAKLHGGEMTIESRLGEGTAVTVRLPGLVLESDTLDLPLAAE